MSDDISIDDSDSYYEGVIDKLNKELEELRQEAKKRSTPDLNKAYENYLKSVEAVNAELKELRAYKQNAQESFLSLEDALRPDDWKPEAILWDSARKAIMGDEVDA